MPEHLSPPERAFGALSQITENRQVKIRKWLIFREPIFEFCLPKPTVRQSQEGSSWTCMLSWIR